MKNAQFLGIGETGLDFMPNAADSNLQIKVFKQIINLALKYDLPLNIHARNSLDETIQILSSYEKLPKFILHCFDGNTKQLSELLKLGGYIGFNGLITYNDRNKEIIAAIRSCPQVEQFVLETDAPYLAPTIYRGKNNEPKYLELVSARIAKELKLNAKLLHEQLNLNAKKVYNIK